MMPRYWPELAPPLEEGALPFSRLDCASGRSMEVRFGWAEWEVEVLRRLISTPRKAKGAQQATDHDLCCVSLDFKTDVMMVVAYTPQQAMMIVACLKLLTKGAMTILPAKIQCAVVHAVSRLGLYFASPVKCLGGREKPGPFSSSSGLCTKKGRRTDITNVMMEKAMRAMEPMRPTLPVRSPAALTSAGASYRRYTSPTHVVL